MLRHLGLVAIVSHPDFMMLPFVFLNHDYLRAATARWRVRWHHTVGTAQATLASLMQVLLFWRHIILLLLERICLKRVQKCVLVRLSLLAGSLLTIIRCDLIVGVSVVVRTR